MNKEEATKVLSKELAKVKGWKFIVNNAYQKHLLEKALSYYIVEEDASFSSKSRIVRRTNEIPDDKQLKQIVDNYKHDLVSYCKSVNEANYIFLDHLEQVSVAKNNYGTGYYFYLTDKISFFSLITPQDADGMKSLFYKDVSLEVVEAMDLLNIKHFVNDYKSYKKDGFFERLEALKLAKKFVEYFNNAKGDRDGEVSEEIITREAGDTDLLNKSFKKLGVEAVISKTEDRKNAEHIKQYPHYVHVDNLSKVINQLHKVLQTNTVKVSDNFFNFVFTLPYEDQNIEANKAIFKNRSIDFNYIHFLAQEYSGGKHFQEYFDCLDAERQKKVVDNLKLVSVKNQDHNSFLWKKGFKDVDVDYMVLYKTDSENFIDYFAARTADEKRIILKDIMDSDFVNEKVTVWLNDGYLDLMREVGFNG